MYAPICIHIFVYIHTYIDVFTCVYVCACACVCVYVHMDTDRCWVCAVLCFFVVLLISGCIAVPCNGKGLK